MNSDTRVKLKDYVTINVFSRSEAYIETANLLREVRGQDLGMLHTFLLPQLTGANTVADVVKKLDGQMAAEDVWAAIRELERANLIAITDDHEPCGSEPSFAIHGDEELVNRLAALLEANGQRVQPTSSGVADVNILAIQSLLDPSVPDIQRRLLSEGIPHISVGLDFNGNGFVGPLWRSPILSACAVCLRTRLMANSSDSRQLTRYMNLLSSFDRAPMLHRFSSALATMLCGLVLQRVHGSRCGGSAVSATNLSLVSEGSLEVTQHSLLPVPTCIACDGRQAEIAEVPVVGLSAVVDKSVGIVHSLDVRAARIGPSIHLSGTTSADSRLVRPSMRAVSNGGAGFTNRQAVESGIGESIERYCAGVYNSRSLVLATYRDLQVEAVPPEQFARFSDEQLRAMGPKFVAFDEDTPVRWTPAVRWTDRASVLVPASHVFLPYRRVAGEAPIGQSISTGQAAGSTMTSAILGGLREVVERDALAISWMHRLPPRLLDPNVLDDSPVLRRHLALRSDWEVSFFDLSLDDVGTSVVAVMDQGKDDDRVMTFGCACRCDTSSAMEKAFLEAAQGIQFVRRLVVKFKDWNAGRDFVDVTGFHEHAILYSKYPELRPEVGYLLTKSTAHDYRIGSPRSVGSPTADVERLDRMVHELLRNGYETYVVNLTTPDAAMAGVSVVKVLVPGYVHVAGSHVDRLLGSARLYSVPQGLGLTSKPDNPYPHPLP